MKLNSKVKKSLNFQFISLNSECIIHNCDFLSPNCEIKSRNYLFIFHSVVETYRYGNHIKVHHCFHKNIKQQILMQLFLLIIIRVR